MALSKLKKIDLREEWKHEATDFTKPLVPGPLEIGFDYHFGVPQNHGDASGVYVRNRQTMGLRSDRLDPSVISPYGRAYFGIDAPQRVDVTGSRPGDTEQRRRATAAKIVIGRDEIDRFGDSTTSEVLKRLPGITMPGNACKLTSAFCPPRIRRRVSSKAEATTHTLDRSWISNNSSPTSTYSPTARARLVMTPLR